jgi:hypothetical protein
MKITKLTLIFAACVYLAGCATGATMENMTYRGDQKVYPEGLKGSMELFAVTGGDKTNPLWTSEISSEAFSDAVKESLSAQGLWSDNGRYQLNVKMLKVDQPMFGLDLKVTTHVQYLLTDTRNDTIVLDEAIVASHTATFNDAFAAIKRLRLANEGSGLKNIEAFLEKLSALNINKQEISVTE